MNYRENLDTVGAREFLVILSRMPSADAANAALADPQVMCTDDPILGGAPKTGSSDLMGVWCDRLGSCR